MLYWNFYSFQTQNSETIVDSRLDSLIQIKIDLRENQISLQAFNVNYMTDYKAYVLGLNVEELDRIETYRQQNKWFYSLNEFQSISKITDSLKLKISPFLKFPSKRIAKNDNQKIVVLADINIATAEELKNTHGIGVVFSKRIIAYRTSLGGFNNMNQLFNVYGLDSVVVVRLKSQYKVY